MSLLDIDFYNYHDRTITETQRVHEPVGMVRDELIQWYMEQPKTFRTRNSRRIADLCMQSTLEEAEALLEMLLDPTEGGFQ